MRKKNSIFETLKIRDLTEFRSLEKQFILVATPTRKQYLLTFSMVQSPS